MYWKGSRPSESCFPFGRTKCEGDQTFQGRRNGFVEGVTPGQYTDRFRNSCIGKVHDLLNPAFLLAERKVKEITPSEDAETGSWKV
jgi:hypothetical protein